MRLPSWRHKDRPIMASQAGGSCRANESAQLRGTSLIRVEQMSDKLVTARTCGTKSIKA